MSTDTPLVSILTPTYNRADFLPLAIESVLNQSYTNIEMHLVDDGSTDNTSELVKKYLSDSRLHYYQQENQGQSVARNKALKHCKGDLICFLDSDNLFHLDKISTQVSILQSNPEVDIVYGDSELIDINGEVFSTQNIKRHSGMIYEKMLLDNIVGMNTAMARRKCFDELGGLDESIRVADDYDLWLRFSTKYRFLYEPAFFAQYRIMEDQISSDKSRRFESNRRIIEKSMIENPELITDKYRNYVWCNFYVRKGRTLARMGKRGEALSNYRKALHYDYFSSKPWKNILKLLLP